MKLRILELIIRDLEVARTVLVVAAIVAFFGYLVLGAGR